MTTNAPRLLPEGAPPVAPAPTPPSRNPSLLWLLPGSALIGVVAIGVLVAVRLQSPLLPPASTTVTVVAPSVNVVLAIRDLARLETNTFHLERVVDLSDQQTRLFGLVEAKDAILLVAVGDVVAGVDLQKVREADVTADQAQKRVTVRLPAPEIFSTTLDNDKTRVFLRKTDALAQRHEDLEGRARREAAAGMEKAAKDGGILDRARGGADKAVRALLRSAGFEQITLEWRAE